MLWRVSGPIRTRPKPLGFHPALPAGRSPIGAAPLRMLLKAAQGYSSPGGAL